MGGDSICWHRPSWGIDMAQLSMVGDHVSVLSGITGSKASGMVSDQAVIVSTPPHEGCRDASRPPAIVGLLRNSLSEARSYTKALLFYCSPVKKRCAVRFLHKSTAVLLFSCLKKMCGTFLCAGSNVLLFYCQKMYICQRGCLGDSPVKHKFKTLYVKHTSIIKQ